MNKYGFPFQVGLVLMTVMISPFMLCAEVTSQWYDRKGQYDQAKRLMERQCNTRNSK